MAYGSCLPRIRFPAAAFALILFIGIPLRQAECESFQAPRVIDDWAVSSDPNVQVGASAIAVTPRGDVLVATARGTIARYSDTGELEAEWGPGPGKRFQSATSVALDPSGLVYVTEYWGHHIRVFDDGGHLIREWGSKGVGPGQFNNPSGVAVDRDGTVFVADRENHRIQVFTATGRYRSAWSGKDGGRVQDPIAIAFDRDSRLYVAEGNGGSIKIFTKDGGFLTQWGPGPVKSPPIKMITSMKDRAGVTAAMGVLPPMTPEWMSALCDSTIHKPFGIAVGRSGAIYTLNGECHQVQKFARDGRFLGAWWIGSRPGFVGLSAAGLAVGPNDEVYVADYDGHIWSFGYGPTHEERLLEEVLGKDFPRVIDELTSIPVGRSLSIGSGEVKSQGGVFRPTLGPLGFERKPVLRSMTWNGVIPTSDVGTPPRVERAVRRLLGDRQGRIGVEITANLRHDEKGRYELVLERTNLALHAAGSNPDTCDLRIVEGALDDASGVWNGVLPGLQARWPDLARLLLRGDESLEDMMKAVQEASKPSVSDSDRDMVYLAVDQWLRSRPGPAEPLGAEWNRFGYRSVGDPEYGGATYCGSVLPLLAVRAGKENEWADRALVVLLDLGWSTDCSEDFEGAVFGNEIFAPVLKHGEKFLREFPQSRIWPSIALRVGLAHETAWSLGLESAPNDFPDYRKGFREHGRRALELYRSLLPRTKDPGLIRGLRKKIESIERERDTKCHAYYITGEC